MALSSKVKEEILEAQSHLRAALRDAAVNEKSCICKQIADILQATELVEKTENLMDKLETRQFGDSGMFGHFLH
tara:strand:- start:888 stop:1109 length:222 start_codon:yes stop_codon:yes gene_type:complete